MLPPFSRLEAVMNLSTFASSRSVAFVLALTLAVSAGGCSTDAEGDAQPPPPAPANDIEVGQVFAGAEAAIKIIRAFDTYTR